MDEAHEFAIAEVFHTGSSVDTLNPKRAEVAFFILTVTVSISKTFFPSVLGYGPNVTAATEVTTCEFKDFFTASS